MPRGVKLSEEHRQKLSEAKIGHTTSLETRKKISKAMSGANAPNWRGGISWYVNVHRWVKRELGKPQMCENCDTTIAKRFEWANLSGEYKWDLADWARLCTSCHHLYDDNNETNLKSKAKLMKGKI